jgi:phenylalanyl-tRNA synthetase beta chain
VALFETAPVTLPRGEAAAPILPVDRRPTDGEWDDLQKALPDQPLHLAVVLAGERERSGWWGAGRPAVWADAIQAVRDVAYAVGVPLTVQAASRAPWHPGRCAEILVADTPLGFAGELHPRVCAAYGLPARAAAAEVDLDLLLMHARPVASVRLSSYPVAKVDVALVVDASVTAEALADALREGAGPLLESVRLFDLYTGAQVGEGRTSLAFALRFRADDRTLTDAEVTAARDAAVARAADLHGAVLRG